MWYKKRLQLSTQDVCKDQCFPFLFPGNHYGTPKPPKDPTGPSPFRRTNSAGTLLPGQHPSSDGKRRRNRSNIETSSNKTSPSHTAEDAPPPFQRKRSLQRAQNNSNSSLGPLPSNWEMAYTEDGTPYFIEWVPHSLIFSLTILLCMLWRKKQFHYKFNWKYQGWF